MLKLNNKGFAISGILYATLILFLVLMLGTLSILASGKFLLDKTKNDLVDSLNNEEPIEIILEYTEITYPVNYSETIDFFEGVTAYDNEGNEISLELISYSTDLDLNVAGTYQIKYKATKGNQTGEAIRTVIVEQTSYADATGAPIPELSTGMIPIRWNGTSWIKADITQEWYNYATKQWANAVLVTEATRATYQSAAAGTVITGADVMAYLVWIPRYKYRLFNVAATSVSVQAIEVTFENKTTAKSAGTANGEWLTHPAFTFGTTEQNGIWVGKFETTGTAATPTVKNGVASLRGQMVANQYSTAQLFNTVTTYGLTSEFDAHMMKNMEWGAVAYLSRSTYGKATEIWKNPSRTYITGCAGTSATATDVSGCSYLYTTSNGQQASTTGNVYGIYDMSGGNEERMMGAMYEYPNNLNIYAWDTGFNPTILDTPEMVKYLDKYLYGETSDDQAAYNRRKLGDATGETRGWYSDSAYFVYYYCDEEFFDEYIYTFFIRGGDYYGTTVLGVFNFWGESGNSIGPTFRLTVSKD